MTSGTGLLAYCGHNTLNHLINESRPEDPLRKDLAKQFIEEVDVGRLIENSNRLPLDDFFNFGSLLERLAFYGPSWAIRFVNELDWARLNHMILEADPKHAPSVAILVRAVYSLAEAIEYGSGDRYVEDILPYLVYATNERPSTAICELEEVIWNCLGYLPHMFRQTSPTEKQVTTAERFVHALDPGAFAAAMAKASPRDLDSLGRSFFFIHEVDKGFSKRVAGVLDIEQFSASTSDEWRCQSGELQRLLMFFCEWGDFEPVHGWTTANAPKIGFIRLFGGAHPMMVNLVWCMVRIRCLRCS
jgi:hypothetical protein